jgi:hypothetical protein
MSTFTLTVIGPSVGTLQKGYTVPDADAGLILQAWGAKLGSSDPQTIVEGIGEELMNYVNRETEQYHLRADQAAVPVRTIRVEPV